jgi:hypothetical protein
VLHFGCVRPHSLSAARKFVPRSIGVLTVRASLLLRAPARVCAVDGRAAAEVKARLVNMFLTAEEGPVASHRDRVAPETSPAMENTGVHPHLG